MIIIEEIFQENIPFHPPAFGPRLVGYHSTKLKMTLELDTFPIYDIRNQEELKINLIKSLFSDLGISEESLKDILPEHFI